MASGSPDVTAVLSSPVTRANGTARPRTQHPKHESSRKSHGQTSHEDSDSGLPSVVQDSEQGTSAPGLESQDLKLLSPIASERLRAMGGQLVPTPGTQLISQSYFEAVLEKDRSTLRGHQDGRSSSQRTYEEGDSGHVDITSSFVMRHEEVDDLEDSEPVDISPARTQTQMTQFPESQRFKTPVTAGKKRTYSGYIVDTPAPARNPLQRDGQSISVGGLGLSQAFAATQAISSPLSNDLPTGPRSDRPSPNIDVETRPISGISSSPLVRPTSELRRTVTEPASRYVSMQQSQADRLRQEKLQNLRSVSLANAFDEDFEEEDSLVARGRRQKEREQKAKQELKSLSSPILPPREAMISSTVEVTYATIDNARRDVHAQTLLPPPTSIGDVIDADDATASVASEAETEQEEDMEDMAVDRLTSPADEDDDKENNAILVPKTGPRYRLGYEQQIAHVDASPSLRQTNQPAAVAEPTDFHSSGPFRIMDSQPSQSRSRVKVVQRAMQGSSSDVIDFIGRTSNTVGNEDAMNFSSEIIYDDPASPIITKKSTLQQPEHKVETDIPGADSGTFGPTNSTIPETDSNARASVPDSRLTTDYNNVSHKKDSNVDTTDYETAPTHKETKSSLQHSQTSSPIRATPPGRKRRRMLEISAEPSPRKSQSQISFNAEAILRLDEDQVTAELLASSPSKQVHVGKPADLDRIPFSNTSERAGNQLSSDFHGEDGSPDPHTTRGWKDRSYATSSMPTPDTSQEVVRPGRYARIQSANTNIVEDFRSPIRPQISARTSIFDIQASPEQRIAINLPQTEDISIVENPKFKTNRLNKQHESRMQRRLQSQAEKGQKTLEGLHVNGGLDNPKTDVSAIEAGEDQACENALSVGITARHMVFAYYKGEPRGYYPAKSLSRTSNGGHQIQWEGYAPEEIDVHGVKALDLRLGDAIKILADGFPKIPYLVHGFKDRVDSYEDVVTDIHGYRTLMVVPKKRKSLPADATMNTVQEISVSSIYLDTNMWAQLKARDQEIIPVGIEDSTSGATTPMPQISTTGTPSSRNRRQMLFDVPSSTPISRGIFENMAFAMSYDDVARKNTLSNLVQTNGGMIVQDSFDDLLESENLAIKQPYKDLGFTALLTDRHSRKEKYVQALALGIPCLSGRWIEASTKHNHLLGWKSYLLPAGESAELDHATRSRDLPTFDTDNVSLKNMLESRPNLLNDAAVSLVVGRGKAEIKRAPYLFLVKALGARHIHKFPDIASAKDFLNTASGKQCSWIFVDDKDVQAMRNLLRQKESDNVGKSKSRSSKAGSIAGTENFCKVAGNELIVQSLILGRLYES